MINPVISGKIKVAHEEVMNRSYETNLDFWLIALFPSSLYLPC